MNLPRLFPLPLLVLILSMRLAGTEEVVETGWWSQYDEGPTLAQIDYHGFSPDDADGFIAVLNCDRVGEYAQIKVNNSDWFRVRVFDCLGGDGNPSWWRENHIIGEIDYYTAVKHGVENQGGVRAHLAYERDLERDDQFSDLDLNPRPTLVNKGTSLDNGGEAGTVVLKIPTNERVNIGLMADVENIERSVLKPDVKENLDWTFKYDRFVRIYCGPYQQVNSIPFLFSFCPVNPGPMLVPSPRPLARQYDPYCVH